MLEREEMDCAARATREPIEWLTRLMLMLMLMRRKIEAILVLVVFKLVDVARSARHVVVLSSRSVAVVATDIQGIGIIISLKYFRAHNNILPQIIE
jgi:hypothetical protein